MVQSSLALLTEQCIDLAEIVRHEGHIDYPASEGAAVVVASLCGLTAFWHDGRLARLKAADLDVALETWNDALPAPVANDDPLHKLVSSIIVRFRTGSQDHVAAWLQRLSTFRMGPSANRTAA